jgi:hypothetical protein
MKLLSLRWIFLLAAVLGAGRCVFFDATPARVGFALACALLWYWLSRRKVHSLDRETLGVPPRR